MYWIIFIGLMLVSWFISYKLRSKFEEYSQIPLSNGMSGAEAASQMLADHGIRNVEITCVEGSLTDHYNPANYTVNLSEAVFYGRNAAAVAVATHECGHAVQHAEAYSMLQVRSAMVPVQNASATIMNVIFMISIFGGIMYLGIPYLWVLLLIIGCYSVVTAFSLITLPVEFDASKRALAWIQNRKIVNNSEYNMAKDALHWAAMTYIVAAISSLVGLAFYVLQLFGGSDD